MMKTHRMEEFEAPISVARLIEIATDWSVPLSDLYVEEYYEMGGSGQIFVIHMT